MENVMKKNLGKKVSKKHTSTMINGAARSTFRFYRDKCAGGKTNKSGKVYDHLEHMVW